MTIGQVVDILKNDYPNISISKIRYLEDEGLIKPGRTNGGYRNFTKFDIERLKTILVLQNERYLPLQVIKSKLKENPSIAIEKESSKDDKKALIEKAEIFNDTKYSISDLSKKTGVSISTLEDMIDYGLVKERGENGRLSSADRKVAEIVKSLKRFGIDPRHLKMLVSSSERQATLYRQIFEPLFRNKTTKNTERIKSMLDELRQALDELESILLNREINDLIDKLN